MDSRIQKYWRNEFADIKTQKYVNIISDYQSSIIQCLSNTKQEN